MHSLENLVTQSRAAIVPLESMQRNEKVGPERVQLFARVMRVHIADSVVRRECEPWQVKPGMVLYCGITRKKADGENPSSLNRRTADGSPKLETGVLILEIK